jgi:hypothetical protein
MGKNILDECGCVNALFAERFTNIPSKVHYINAFKL